MSDIVLGLRGAKVIKASPCLPGEHDWCGQADRTVSHLLCAVSSIGIALNYS